MNKNLLNSIQLTRPKKNMFDLSHDVKLSCNMGELVPVMCEEVIPTDHFKISCESLIRFAPMVAPIMHRVDVTIHYFFVPNRILWENFEKFITNTKVAGLLPAAPTLIVGDIPNGYSRLMDYFGIPDPTGLPNSEVISAIPFAAYQKIYDEYYRDQNLITSTYTPLSDGDNSGNIIPLSTLQKRAWEHDYFTAALPFAQKGDPVTMPFTGATDVDVYLKPGATNPGAFRDVVATHPALGAGAIDELAGPVPFDDSTFHNSITPTVYDPRDSLSADTSSLTGSTTINDLRRAFRLQEWLEKAARGGSRYVENILIFFGLKSQDSRLQRPEYITGTKSAVTISEVLQTSETDGSPQGNMAGHGLAVVNGYGSGYFVQEHGYIIGIMSVMPKTAYQQGIPKHFLKTTDPFQIFWPPFANIGEQEVLNRELFAFVPQSEDTFGYIPRYAEYKYAANRVAGEFRTTLDFWHMGRIFAVPPAAPPALNADFINSDPTHRIFAVTDPDEHKLWIHVFHKIKAVRPMPKFGTPSF